jgi:hypothetical protein
VNSYTVLPDCVSIHRQIHTSSKKSRSQVLSLSSTSFADSRAVARLPAAAFQYARNVTAGFDGRNTRHGVRKFVHSVSTEECSKSHRQSVNNSRRPSSPLSAAAHHGPIQQPPAPSRLQFPCALTTPKHSNTSPPAGWYSPTWPADSTRRSGQTGCRTGPRCCRTCRPTAQSRMLCSCPPCPAGRAEVLGHRRR